MDQSPTQGNIFRFWLPLAAMWLLMALEQPTLSAVIARLPDQELNLAAWGLTFSLALIVESPVIMFLTMGTALARNRQSYRFLMRFTHLMALGLTALHLAIGLTPAYGWIVGRLVGAPAEVIEPSRMAFVLMATWPGAIAYRRFWQGVLIRHGQTRAVATTTAIRLASTAGVALAGLRMGSVAGATLAGISVGVGVVVSALAAGWIVRSTVSQRLPAGDPADAPLTLPALLRFYLPLALTSFISLAGQPIISVGLSRAPLPLQSLAIWPVLNGLTFLLRSLGVALQEVVVALLHDEANFRALQRFSWRLALLLSAVMALIAVTPLANVWFLGVAGLSPELAQMARLPAILLILTPGLTALTSWQRGVLINLNHTSPITLATALNIITLLVIMLGGAQLLVPIPGVVLAANAMTVSLLVDVGYLTWQAGVMRRQAAAWT